MLIELAPLSICRHIVRFLLSNFCHSQKDVKENENVCVEAVVEMERKNRLVSKILTSTRNWGFMLKKLNWDINVESQEGYVFRLTNFNLSI